MARTYRPAVAFPAELTQEGHHFASGVNHPDEIRGLALSGRWFGITATTIRTGLLEACELFAGGVSEIFVDSGAFSEVEFNPELGRFETVKPITAEGWREHFALYRRVARAFGRRARVVAPDKVGDQDETLARLARYALDVAAVAALRAQIIVPIQKGALPMSVMFARACEILDLAEQPIAGIPMRKDATSLEDLAEFARSMPWYGCRFHLLGIGPESPRFAAAIRTICSIRPNAEITSDSVTIRRLVGRTNGRGAGPRVLTRYQDEARAAGITRPKAHALIAQGLDERDLELDRAMAAGWFDEELYDSAEGAIAEVAKIRVERRAHIAATRDHVQLVLAI